MLAPRRSVVSSLRGLSARLRLPDGADLGRRCGDDVVRLRPEWPTIVAATRFAQRSEWRFGVGGAMIACAGAQTVRLAATDTADVRFDFTGWTHAYARCKGQSREIAIFAADGSPVVAVHLDRCDATLDEVIWLLMDDNQQCAAETRERRPFVPACDALARVLLEAVDERLPLRVEFVNRGGRVAWSPGFLTARDFGAYVELSSSCARAHVGTRFDLCRVHEDGRNARSIEASADSGTSMLRVDILTGSPHDRAIWQRMCDAIQNVALTRASAIPNTGGCTK